MAGEPSGDKDGEMMSAPTPECDSADRNVVALSDPFKIIYWRSLAKSLERVLASRSSVVANKPQMRGITDFSSAKVLDWGKIPKDHVDLHIEAERDLIQANKVIENLRAALPIGVAPKGRWQTALYYSGYWWVKKSHAENALSARVENEPLSEQELTQLIDYHDNQDAAAEAMGYDTASLYHAKRSREFLVMRDAIHKRQADTLAKMVKPEAYVPGESK